MRASSCTTDMLTLPHLHRQLSTILQQLWGLLAGEDTSAAAVQDTEAAGKWDSLKPKIYTIFTITEQEHGLSSQQLNARSLQPDIFSGISSLRLKHQCFCSSKAWTPAVLARLLAQSRETGKPQTSPKKSRIFFSFLWLSQVPAQVSRLLRHSLQKKSRQQSWPVTTLSTVPQTAKLLTAGPCFPTPTDRKKLLTTLL